MNHISELLIDMVKCNLTNGATPNKIRRIHELTNMDYYAHFQYMWREGNKSA